MKRFIDLLFSLLLIPILFFPLVLIILAVKMTSSGPAIYWSTRIGIDNITFEMPKFRTMAKDTPAIATHLLEDPEKYYTSIGKLLRKFSLDEIPQLWSIIKGDMSFIGPRPALFNQVDLIQLRTERGIHKLKPGITGWAQVNGRDELSILEKVNLEEEYLKNMSYKKNLYILWLTVIKVLSKSNVSH